jgi:hypothetical protein
MATRSQGSKMVRIGAWAALAAGAALVVKVAHIYATDGADSTIQAVLYLGGAALGILGAAGVGAGYGTTRPRKIALGVLTFFGFAFFLTMLSDSIGSLVESVVDGPAYVADEFPIALAGLGWLFAGYKLLNRSDRPAQVA